MLARPGSGREFFPGLRSMSYAALNRKKLYRHPSRSPSSGATTLPFRGPCDVELDLARRRCCLTVAFEDTSKSTTPTQMAPVNSTLPAQLEFESRRRDPSSFLDYFSTSGAVFSLLCHPMMLGSERPNSSWLAMMLNAFWIFALAVRALL